MIPEFTNWIDSTGAALMPFASLVFVMIAAFTRLSVFIFLVPSIGERTVNTRIRLILAAMLTWLMLPGLFLTDFPEINQLSVAVALIAKEAVIGLFFGISLRMLVFCLQIVGNIVSQSMSISQPLGEGIATEPNTTLSTCFMVAGTTLLVTLDFHIEAFGLLYHSFTAVPLGTIPSFDSMAYDLTHRAVQVLRISLTLAFPFVLLNFIYNLLLGFVNRAMPQLLVSFVGMPAIIGVGMILLALTSGTLMTVWLGFASEQTTSLGF